MADLHRISKDHRRFKKIVRGKIKDNLRDYMSQGEMTGQQGGETVKIPIPRIDLPRFKYGQKQQGGVGQGDGEVGDVIGRGEEGPGEGGEAGSEEGDHALEVDVDLDELAEIMGEELELPNIEAKGKKQIETKQETYSGISKTGPEGLLDFKRTYKEALKRQLATGEYNPDDPVIYPISDDKRYRSWSEEQIPESNAVIIYMMDVSGSMGDEQKEMVRIESFWIDTWLRNQYDGIESRYVIHDATAKEVDRETFFHTRESGGTMISSAYKLCHQIIDEDYNPEQWNIYPFHFSDGDNWSVDDTSDCMTILQKSIIPASNMFCYGQVESPYGSGQFIKDLDEHFGEDEHVTLSEIENREAIYDSIKEFLGKGL
jgi:sporulation protein YhbH